MASADADIRQLWEPCQEPNLSKSGLWEEMTGLGELGDLAALWGKSIGRFVGGGGRNHLFGGEEIRG